VLLRFYILPNSSENKICGLHNGAIKLKLRAPPVDGAANRAIIDYLSEFLKVPKKQIEIKRGDLSRNKQVELHVDVIDEAVIKQKLGV
jgi:hypothetical protein